MTEFINLQNQDLIAAVIGHPIKHSRSPLIHNFWLEKSNIKGVYGAIEVEPRDLQDFCNNLRTSHLKGINVTLPHKEKIIPFLDEVDETARKIGAVNTVKIENKKLIGTNTDAYGFIRNLKNAAPDFNFSDAKVLVLGAGGAARAVLYGLQKEGAYNINVTNRTQEKAEVLADEFKNIGVVPWEQRDHDLAGCTLLVNTTSLGMQGQPDLELDFFALSTDAVVYDLIYNPLATTLLLATADKGCKTLGGLGMLAWQAEKAFSLWFGKSPSVSSELMERLEKSL